MCKDETLCPLALCCTKSIYQKPLNGKIATKPRKVSIQPSLRLSLKRRIMPGTTCGGMAVTCWAHTRSGKRCRSLVKSREGEPVPIPYCNRHLAAGDGALKVVEHPFAGRCLVARFDLPANYRVAFFGMRGRCPPCNHEDRSLSYYPPDPLTGSNYILDPDGTKRRKTNNYNGALNPSSTGDLLQYCACPGPSERQNLKSSFQYFGTRNGAMGGLEFVTTERVARNTQLVFWYGSGWWSARGLTRLDVGTRKYPAPRKRDMKSKIAVRKSDG